MRGDRSTAAGWKLDVGTRLLGIARRVHGARRISGNYRISGDYRVHAKWGFPDYVTDAEREAAAERGLNIRSVFGHIVPFSP